MGKYFNKHEAHKAKREKEMGEKIRLGHYIPIERIANRIFNESMRPSNSKECYPDYVQDWGLMNKINQ